MSNLALIGLRRVFVAKRLTISQQNGPIRHCSTLPTKMPEKTAGIVIIGDEILKGQTLDTNSQKICQKFYQLGFKVKQTVIIPDQLDVIAQQVASFASTYDYVVTSGGVGPTHDDLTYAGVAQAFDLKLARHPILVQLLEKHFGPDHSQPAFKMSEVPESASILWNKERKNSFPLVSIKNVYILPGIPAFMERCLQCLYETLQPFALPAPDSLSVYVVCDEVSITWALNSVVKRYQQHVSFGSYPTINNNYYKVQITLESKNEQQLQKAYDRLLETLPKDSVIKYVADPLSGAEQRLAKMVGNYEFKEVSETLLYRLHFSYWLMQDQCLMQYTPDQVCISFNGGKDCTASLHLYHCAMKTKFPEWNKPLKALYIKCKDPFPEVEEFIKEASQRYNLDLQTVQGPIIQGLEKFLASNPEIKAILMGNRSTDPSCQHMCNFQLTDEHWPQVMRIFPILQWTYAHVWEFIRYFYLPYCILYDRGYTSLGSAHDTYPNPNLRYGYRDQVKYHPAYKLKDGSEERDGRLKS